MLELLKFDHKIEEIKLLQELSSEWQESFWPLESVLEALARVTVALYYLKFKDKASWIGCVLLQLTPPSSEMLFVFVTPTRRQQGVGQKLLELLTEHLKTQGIKKMTLEVRHSNIAAIKLYEGLGMIKVGQRLGYFANGEHAWLFSWTLIK